MRHPHGLRAAAAAAEPEVLESTTIGAAANGGFFAGYISHTANGVATHALIVAPRATGATGTGYTLTTLLAAKTSATDTTGTGSSFDGAANTAAMVAAGIADHPAADFCVNLSIGGYNDWYLPAVYELDIAYQNLKPTTTSNNTSSGINAYSVPARTVNRTASVPTQTTVLAFRSTGAEPFNVDFHWSSTTIFGTNSDAIIFESGLQTSAAKTEVARLRAFRKVAL